jgi:anti-anti-sigma factor
MGQAVVIRLDGRMTAEAGTGWMAAAYLAAGAAGARHVLCDCRGVRGLDCTGIGQLLDLRRFAHGMRLTFAIAAVERRPRRMLERAGLVHVLRVFSDCQAAAAALGLRDPVPRCTMHPWFASPRAARSC